MSNAVALKQDWTPEQMKLITSVVAKNATPDELKLFLYRCKNMNLDPLKPGQIYFIKYGTGPGTIVVGIEGFRSKAAQTGKLSGIKRGVIRNDKGACIGAWAEVYRVDWQHPAREEVSLAEYDTGKNQWAKMPETMIKKVAEAATLRMAFPDDLGGIYTKEEMDQADRTGQVYPDQPEPEDGIQTGLGYRIPFGKFKARSLEEIPLNDLRGYVEYLEKRAEAEGKTLTGQVLEFVDMAAAFIASFENGVVEE